MTKIINFLKLNKQNICSCLGAATLYGGTIGALDGLIPLSSKPCTGMVKGAIIGMTFPVSIPYCIAKGINKEREMIDIDYIELTRDM